MHWKKTNNRSLNVEAAEISTQEYIRRVEEDSDQEFTRNPWLFALDYLRSDGFGDATPLSAINKFVNIQRIDKVVAIVKSCNPNGLGDMMVTLKDPSDTICATVHRKVLSMGDFGKLIAVGSILVLQKVVAFSSSCASCYLNITRSNVVKVISVDCGVQNFLQANLLAAPVFAKSSEIPPKTVDLISRRTEGVIGDLQRSYNDNLKGKPVTEKLMGKENSSPAISLISSKQIGNAANTISLNHIDIDLVDSGPVARELDNSCRSIQPGPVTAEGMARNLEDYQSPERRRKGKDFSSAPCITENLDTQHAWRGNGAQTGWLLRGNNNCTKTRAEELDIQVGSPAGACSTMVEKLNCLVSCGANDVQNEIQPRGICSPSSMSENLANQDINKICNSQKQRQLKDTMLKSMDAKQDDREKKEANGVKKQRLALISRISVQEWTDEQLGILDMDED